MKRKKLFATFMIGMLLVAATVSIEAHAATATRQTYEQSNTQGNGINKSRKQGKVKKSAHDVGRATKDTGKGIANGGEKAGEGVAKGSRSAAKATVVGAKDASKATGKGAKKTGKATAKAGKKIGRVFK